MIPASSSCVMADTKNQHQPPATSERKRSETSDPPTGLHEWRGHTREGIAWEVHKGDATSVLKNFQPGSFDCVVTSPPYYWQRDYGVVGQIGQEKTIAGFIRNIADAMDQVRRVLA